MGKHILYVKYVVLKICHTTADCMHVDHSETFYKKMHMSRHQNIDSPLIYKPTPNNRQEIQNKISIHYRAVRQRESQKTTNQEDKKKCHV